MTDDPAIAYAVACDAVDEQRSRLGLGGTDADRWSSAANRFVADPHRRPDANLKAVMEYVLPQHVVLDVGGGAGRYALPLALRCSEVINVEPSRGMGEAFEASAQQAGISNVRWIAADWLAAGDVSGDVSLAVNVTYFVRDIVPFVEKLVAASRERVVIAMTLTPPPNQSSRLFELVNGEPQAPVPGYRELVPVLWQMGIVPDIRVLAPSRPTALAGIYASREEAIESVLSQTRRSESESSHVRKLLDRHFDELLEPSAGGFQRRASGDTRMILVTWRT